jgi:hypothetical protein
MNKFDVISHKDTKFELFKEGVRRNLPIITLFLTVYIMMLWFFRDNYYSVLYLFNWLTGTFFIVFAIYQIRHKEYYHRVNMVWGMNPESWIIGLIVFVICGILCFMIGIINYL